MRAVAMVTVVAMCGCGGPGGASKNPPPPSTTSSTTPPTTAPPTTTLPPTTTPPTTTATGCDVPDPRFIDCTAESRQSDGTLFSVETYDSCGRMVEQLTYSLDQPFLQRTTTYFADGRENAWSFDYAPFDGVPEMTWTFNYDSQLRGTGADVTGLLGPCTFEFVYTDSDDLYDEAHYDCVTPAWSETYVSDQALPELFRWTWRERDYGQDGTIDETESYVYDAATNSVSTDYQSSGPPGYGGQESRYTEYGIDDRVEYIEADTDQDGIANQVTDYLYDPEGRMVGFDGFYDEGGYYMDLSIATTFSCPGGTTATTTPSRAPTPRPIDPLASPEEMGEHIRAAVLGMR